MEFDWLDVSFDLKGITPREIEELPSLIRDPAERALLELRREPCWCVSAGAPSQGAEEERSQSVDGSYAPVPAQQIRW